MAGSRQRFTCELTRRTVEIIDSMAFVHESDRASRSGAPRRRTVNMSSSPSREDAAARTVRSTSPIESMIEICRDHCTNLGSTR